MKYILFDSAGDLFARYDSVIHGDSVPADAVEVDEDLFWKTISESDGIWNIDQQNGEISKRPLPPEAPYIPQSVTWRQANLALIEVGKYEDVQALLSAIEDPIEKLKAEVEYKSPTYEYSSGFLNFVWSSIGGTEQGLKDLFILADTL